MANILYRHVSYIFFENELLDLKTSFALILTAFFQKKDQWSGDSFEHDDEHESINEVSTKQRYFPVYNFVLNLKAPILFLQWFSY